MLLNPNTTGSLLLRTMLYLTTQNNQMETETNTLYHLNIGEETKSLKCYGIYGCFNISSPWTSVHRPVSVFPESPEKVNPGFWLYLDLQQTEPIYLDLYDPDGINVPGFNPNAPIYMIAHGYLEAGDRPWIKDLRLELLRRESCSVIVIDWHGGSSPPYTQAVANIRLVASMTAHLLETISAYTGPMKLDHVHIIGHSLGAHLSGYVGYTLQRDFNMTVGRISGLDPAEPHFAQAAAPVRLGPSAARYVDVVHTDASTFIRGGLGIIERVGHVDFYPNGGKEQPGCAEGVVHFISAEQGSFIQGVRRFLGCNHIRSYEYFTESINSPCSFTAIACPSYEAFQNGDCFDCSRHRCLTFGYHSRTPYGSLVERGQLPPGAELVLYLMTGSESPFCRGHYRVTVHISNGTESRAHGGEIGTLWFDVHPNAGGAGGRSSSGPFALNSGRYHEPGATYRAVVPARAVLDPRSVSVEWQYNSSLLNPLTWRLLSSPMIYVDRIVIDTLESQRSITVCPKRRGAPMVSHKRQLWLPSYCK